jgi:hypothetical protein
MIAEGETFTFESSFDPVGYLGDLHAHVDWGDGTRETVSLGRQSVPNGVRIEFNYSRDAGFFTSQRRAVLQAVADSITQYFGDSLAAIVPSGSNRWVPQIFDPRTASSTHFAGRLIDVNSQVQTVAANRIIVFAGARDLPAGIKGIGSSGAAREIFGTQEFINTVLGRGQAGALGNSKTDQAPWGGAIVFDSGADTDWYFGLDPDGIAPGQVDFATFAAHELLHVLGFGLEFRAPPGSTDIDTAWENLISGDHFVGAEARRAYPFSGDPPLYVQGSSRQHWDVSIADQGYPNLMGPSLPVGTRQRMTRLDLAAMDDLGWEVSLPNPISVRASHVYGDNPPQGLNYQVDVQILGASFGAETRLEDVRVENVPPSLVDVPQTQILRVGQTLVLPSAAFRATDPGFGNPAGTASSVETIGYEIDWGDGTDPDRGTAELVDNAGVGQRTEAVFGGQHRFDSLGTREVRVVVEDDDGGRSGRTFRVDVIPESTFSLALDQNEVSENGGQVKLQITRDSLTAAVPLPVNLDLAGVFSHPTSLAFDAGQTTLEVSLTAIDDQLPEWTQSVSLIASAPGYAPSQIELDVLDDEPALFQNQRNRFDVDQDGNVRVIDALRVINAIAERGAPYRVDPATDSPRGTYPDVNGDYWVSPNDALQIINHLSRQVFERVGEAEHSDAVESRGVALLATGGLSTGGTVDGWNRSVRDRDAALVGLF